MSKVRISKQELIKLIDSKVNKQLKVREETKRTKSKRRHSNKHRLNRKLRESIKRNSPNHYSRLLNTIKSNKPIRKHPTRLREAVETIEDYGFAISTMDENAMEDYAREDGTILNWNELAKDASKIEQNIMKWLNKHGTARDEGHDSAGDLVGTFFLTDLKLQKVIEDIIDDNEPLTYSSGYLGNYIDNSDLFKGTSKQAEYLMPSLDFFKDDGNNY